MITVDEEVNVRVIFAVMNTTLTNRAWKKIQSYTGFFFQALFPPLLK